MMWFRVDADDYLVRVKAQVMTRDDSSGGWVPTYGGGMSDVALRAKSMADVGDVEYLIHGRRLSDQAVSWLSTFSFHH